MPLRSLFRNLPFNFKECNQLTVSVITTFRKCLSFQAQVTLFLGNRWGPRVWSFLPKHRTYLTSSICTRTFCSVGWNFVRAASCSASPLLARMLDLHPGETWPAKTLLPPPFTFHSHYSPANLLYFKLCLSIHVSRIRLTHLLVLGCIFFFNYVFSKDKVFKRFFSGGVSSDFLP